MKDNIEVFKLLHILCKRMRNVVTYDFAITFNPVARASATAIIAAASPDA